MSGVVGPMVLAVDPGHHTGLAVFAHDGDRWSCRWVTQVTGGVPAFLDAVDPWVSEGRVGRFVVETFLLRSDLAREQSGSDMPSSRVIGAVEVVAWATGIPVSWQAPAVQRPAAGWCRARGVVLLSEAEGAVPHGRSAELHGWAWTAKNPTPIVASNGTAW